MTDLNAEDTSFTSDTFTYQSMLTCIGNKRKLIPHIFEIVDNLRNRLQKPKLAIMDAFTGSGVVIRGLMSLCDQVYTNDLEQYAHIMSRCFLETPTTEVQARIAAHIDEMNRVAATGPYRLDGPISRLYAPQNTDDIKVGERCFYTRENALIIDTLRQYIADSVEPDIQNYLLAPLLIKASIHTNTAGVFKGFYKDGELGCFGGKGKNALSRIMNPIRVEIPTWSSTIVSKVQCCCGDIGDVIKTQIPPTLDVIYLDPPYNQHPYGSNYFMLNVIIENREPIALSRVSGIPTNWNKSAYNSRKTAVNAMRELLANATSKSAFVVLSYNNEGIIEAEDWTQIFEPYMVEKREIDYDTFKGSRNLQNRSNKVVEIMYIISKT
jgi:adenine-specific DNA-methyltransferase